MGRQALLDDVIAHVRHHGLGDTSLRQLAEAVGTSHRMLLYHFGSREGLLAAVVAEIETQERAATARLVGELPSEGDAIRASWARVFDPARAAEERLFFELAAMTAQGRPGTESFAASYIEPWLELTKAAGADPVQTRLDLAVMRGLLLDALVTGDRDGVQAAFDRWVAQRPASSS